MSTFGPQGMVKSYALTGGNPVTNYFGSEVRAGSITASLGAVTASAGALLSPLTTLTYGPAIAINAALGNEFVVTITDAVGFAFSAPTGGTTGQIIRITARNASGGAHGAGTFNAAFKTQAAAFAAIANGFSRTYEFRFNGTNWVETSREGADVAN